MDVKILYTFHVLCVFVLAKFVCFLLLLQRLLVFEEYDRAANIVGYDAIVVTLVICHSVL